MQFVWVINYYKSKLDVLSIINQNLLLNTIVYMQALILRFLINLVSMF